MVRSQFFGVVLGRNEARYENWRHTYLKMYGVDSYGILSLLSTNPEFLRSKEKEIFDQIKETLPVRVVRIDDGRYVAYVHESINRNQSESHWTHELNKFCDHFGVKHRKFEWMSYFSERLAR